MKKLLLILIFASFGIHAQTIQSVTPNTANAGETLQVTITGNNTAFQSISGPDNVSFFNSTSQYLITNSIDLVSDTLFNAMVTVPASAPTGSYTLMTSDLNGGYFFNNALYVTNNNNTITGNIGIDVNGNGCDASDFHMAGIKVNLYNGTANSYTFTDSAGNYIFYVPAGNYVVTPLPELPYYTISPGSATINFAATGNFSQAQNFCLVPNGVHKDLNITILPLSVARPGFNSTYRLVYKNNGNQTTDGFLNFNFDDSRLDFVSATTTPTSQASNNLNWNFVNLLPFQSRTIDIILNANSPQETPAVVIGDIFNFSAVLIPLSGDETPDDNTATFNQVVVGSYDPNDKAATEGSQISISNVGNYLHYIIRFQNTGTFPAENVVVRDMLAANLDKSTLQIVSASHPYRSTLTAGNKLEFFFDNINLPPVTTNEPGSHGFIAFKIKPMNTLGIGSTITNTAEIYFDYNFPIVTNQVTTTVTALGNQSFDFDSSIVLYPNPVKNTLTVALNSASEIASVKIFNQLGQLVKTVNDIGEGPGNTIAVDELKTGTYFVQITSGKETSVKKLIKL